MLSTRRAYHSAVPRGPADISVAHPAGEVPPPKRLHLDRERGLEIEWTDGRIDLLSIEHLRRNSPSADARELRAEIDRNPLAVLPSGAASGPLRANGAELVGNYAVRILFSDGHSTGIYTWAYLRSLSTGPTP